MRRMATPKQKAPKDIRERAAALREEINDLRYRYHVLDDPEVTDEVYDSLTQELLKYEREFPALLDIIQATASARSFRGCWRAVRRSLPPAAAPG